MSWRTFFLLTFRPILFWRDKRIYSHFGPRWRRDFFFLIFHILIFTCVGILGVIPIIYFKQYLLTYLSIKVLIYFIPVVFTLVGLIASFIYYRYFLYRKLNLFARRTALFDMILLSAAGTFHVYFTYLQLS